MVRLGSLGKMLPSLSLWNPVSEIAILTAQVPPDSPSPSLASSTQPAPQTHRGPAARVDDKRDVDRIRPLPSRAIGGSLARRQARSDRVADVDPGAKYRSASLCFPWTSPSRIG